jgi:multiple sugar transport system ATP-binding protein
MMTLQLDRVTKKFKTDVVLDEVSIEAEAGETLVIFGPSGSGKTVLLRVIAGVYEPEEGKVLLQGHDMTDVAPEHRDVGMAFQNFALFPHFSARENVASPLTALGKSGTQIDEQVLSIAKLLKIEHVLEHLPRALSNGQKQRTALARALVAAPKTVLLDDPLRNVDAKLRFEMRLELPRLLRRFGSTVLYVTQDYREAMALADRIAVLVGGKIAQFDTPESIYLRPSSIEVAKLFGEPAINILRGQVNEQANKVLVNQNQFVLPKGFHNKAGKFCKIGIRPESIKLFREKRVGTISLEVITITPLNERSVVLLRSQEGLELLATYPVEEKTAKIGDPFWGMVVPEDLLLFEIESGQRCLPKQN